MRADKDTLRGYGDEPKEVGELPSLGAMYANSVAKAGKD